MKAEIALSNIYLKSFNLEPIDRARLKSGGKLLFEGSATVNVDETSTESRAKAICDLQVVLKGSPSQIEDAGHDEAEESFRIEAVFTGTFTIAAETLGDIDVDQAPYKELAWELANRIYPVARGFLKSTLDWMGLDSAPLAWQINDVIPDTEEVSQT